MKPNKLLLITILLLATITNAQITKRYWMVGGIANIDHYSSHNSRGEEISSGTSNSFRPDLGYFFYDKFVAGAGVDITYEVNSLNDSSNFSYGLGPFARYYFLKFENRVNLLVEANYTYATGRLQNRDPSNNYGFKFGPVVYFNSNVGLELLVKYNYSYFSSDARTAKSVQLGVGFQIHLER
jgi:hypothetical protein